MKPASPVLAINTSIMKSILILGLSLILSGAIYAQNLPACEWCGLADAPSDLSWECTIPTEDEPGEKLVLTGTIFLPDGQTPATDVLIYVYHTNSEGIYPKTGTEKGNAQRHGYLRGWMRTDVYGRYRVHTILPAPYPGRVDPAHVHITLTPPGEPEYWVDSFWFAGDPFITPQQAASLDSPGDGTNVVTLARNNEGVWNGKRNIVLKQSR